MSWDPAVLRAEIVLMFRGYQPTQASLFCQVDLYKPWRMRSRAQLVQGVIDARQARAERRAIEPLSKPWRSAASQFPRARPLGPGWVLCPDCKARGCVPDRDGAHVCWTCNGSGTVHRRMLALARSWQQK